MRSGQGIGKRRRCHGSSQPNWHHAIVQSRPRSPRQLGGFTRDLEREARQGFFAVRLWHADDLVSAICRNYERLPEHIQNDIPLERVWTLVRGDDDL